jgi:hypothetical protein
MNTTNKMPPAASDRKAITPLRSGGIGSAGWTLAAMVTPKVSQTREFIKVKIKAIETVRGRLAM